MLKGIPGILCPELLKILSEMGHGDEIVLADAHFPAMGLGPQVIRADGLGTVPLLKAMLRLIPLDQYDSNHFGLMEVCEGDPVVPVIWEEYREVLKTAEPDTQPTMIQRFDFYERARKAYCIVATGETAQYANIILKKGVVR